jgi:hypothetical protein
MEQTNTRAIGGQRYSTLPAGFAYCHVPGIFSEKAVSWRSTGAVLPSRATRAAWASQHGVT